MSSNLSLQYDEVLSYLIEYDRFVGQLNSPLRILSRSNPASAIHNLHAYDEMTSRPNFLTLRRTPYQIEFAETLASDEERKSPFFAIANAEFPLDALSNHLELKFPDYDFAKLKELHASRTGNEQSVAKIIYLLYAYVLTVALVFLNSIPRTVVSHFGFNFDAYQINVFRVTTVILIFVTAMTAFIGPMIWYTERSARRSNVRFVARVLDYTELRMRKASR
jgi:hypothetical protein